MRRSVVITAFFIIACEPQDQIKAPTKEFASQASEERLIAGTKNAERQAYFGDLHVHTMYSFDSFIYGTTATPDDAYKFAKGGVVTHAGGFDMQLHEPLDFYAVTDHAGYLGSLPAMVDPSTELSKHELAAGMAELGTAKERSAYFYRFLEIFASDRRSELVDTRVSRAAWDDIKAAANRHYEPGKFTTFVAYEYSPHVSFKWMIHRNVIFQGDKAPDMPLSSLETLNPEDLWRWMDNQRSRGFEALAIPHNSNLSGGNTFNVLDYEGNPLDSTYAELRMRNEPLVEIAQAKGASDTHPALSPNDEWADFEILSRLTPRSPVNKPEGSYVRNALMRGLEFQDSEGFNPFKVGIIAGSDTHNASYSGDENNFWGKFGLDDGEPVERGSIPLPEPNEDGSLYKVTVNHNYSAAGLTAVWAEENTRESIYAALRRKEAFGTSGPRIKVRFFAGRDMPTLDAEDVFAKAYESGVPMGGELQNENNSSPEFLVWAIRDAHSAPLQRLQIIKASVRGGEAAETVYDVACSDGLSVDQDTHRCPDNGALVNLDDCSISSDVGDAELKTVWTDPDFNASEVAVYYVRVLENPVCRWSTWDAIRAGVPPREDLHATIQERAWTSPIWLSPLGQ